MASNLKGIKKGDKVIMRLFTGAFSGVKEVEKADKEFIYFTTGKGLSKFSKKTGKMVEPAPKSEKYANFIEEYDQDVVDEIEARKEERRAATKKIKKSKKKVKSEPKVEEDDFEEELEDDEEEEEEEPIPKKKKKVKKVAKRVVEYDDFEDFGEGDE